MLLINDKCSYKILKIRPHGKFLDSDIVNSIWTLVLERGRVKKTRGKFCEQTVLLILAGLGEILNFVWLKQ